MVGYGAVACAAFFLVFTSQAEVLRFLSGDSYRLLAVASLFAFVPFFAYNYGNFWRLVLRLLKFE